MPSSTFTSPDDQGISTDVDFVIEQDFKDIHFAGKKAQNEILVHYEDFVLA